VSERDDDGAATPEGEGFLRATITPRALWVNPGFPGLIHGGPASMTLERLAGRAVLVDLRSAGADDDELVVTVPANAPRIDRAARARLAEWAALVGYRRLWLPDEVLALDEVVPAGRTATVRCPTCTSRWADGSPRFWEHVRELRHFPGYCCACGGVLPEWTVEPDGDPPALPRAGRQPASRAA
jgi:hypothetical protein